MRLLLVINSAASAQTSQGFTAGNVYEPPKEDES
jgi:hypothetical protein